jgi:quercetin dioxygenase-like cupin family protein
MVVGVGDSDEETIQGAGDIVFVPRGAKHWAYNPFDEPQIHIFVYTRPSLSSAGYSLESQGYEEIGKKVELEQGV